MQLAHLPPILACLLAQTPSIVSEPGPTSVALSDQPKGPISTEAYLGSILIGFESGGIALASSSPPLGRYVLISAGAKESLMPLEMF